MAMTTPPPKRFLSLVLMCALCIPTAAFLSKPRLPTTQPSRLHSTPPTPTENEHENDPLRWETLNSGSLLLLPPPSSTSTSHPKPTAVIHFLGGAFVSPRPTVAYRYVLERLASRNYAVVATPFAVDLDYRIPAAAVAQKYAGARAELADRGLGGLPTVGVGHSLGALMQVLLACEYTEKADALDGVALISYNNKSVDGAIPLFRELFVPALAPLEPLTRDERLPDLLSQIQKSRTTAFDALRASAVAARDALGLDETESLLPGVDPLVLRAVDDLEAAASLVDQLPDVLASVARGASEFTPTPAEMKNIVSASFAVPSPLIIRFTNDGIDESDVLAEALRSKGVEAEVVELEGSHVTPLAIDPNAESTPLLPLPEVLVDGGLRGVLLDGADGLVDAVDGYVRGVVEGLEDVVAVRSGGGGDGDDDGGLRAVEDGATREDSTGAGGRNVGSARDYLASL